MKRKAFVVLITCLLCLTLAGGIAYASFSLGIYRNFADLSENETENVDYRITSMNRNSDTTIFTIHGGGISGGTSELASALADRGGFNLYLFEGIKPTDNLNLHITSTSFDEPTALNTVRNSKYTVSFIGTKEENSLITYIGGQNKLLARLIKLHLQSAGFNVQDSPYIAANIAGVLSSNIVNQNKLLFDTHKVGGVQIAVSRGMRHALLEDRAYLQSYISNIDRAISSSWPLVLDLLEPQSEGADSSSMGIQSFFKALFKESDTADIDRIIKEISRYDFDSPEELLAKIKESTNK